MADEVRTGGCRCGAVRYEVRGAPHKVGLCHCTDCRSETGSIGLYYADWPRDAFSSTGDYRTYNGRSFCPVCGSRLFHPGDVSGVEICLGSLDDAPTNLVPTREGWIKRREPWFRPVEGAYQAEEDPPRSA
jgi:hypothetical protein